MVASYISSPRHTAHAVMLCLMHAMHAVGSFQSICTVHGVTDLPSVHAVHAVEDVIVHAVHAVEAVIAVRAVQISNESCCACSASHPRVCNLSNAVLWVCVTVHAWQQGTAHIKRKVSRHNSTALPVSKMPLARWAATCIRFLMIFWYPSKPNLRNCSVRRT